MAICYQGSPFTFHVNFVDSDNVPLEPTDPVIDVFWFNDLGEQQVLVADAPLIGLGAGQYVYFYTPLVVSGTMIYAWMRGADGESQVSAEDSVMVIERLPFCLKR